MRLRACTRTHTSHSTSTIRRRSRKSCCRPCRHRLSLTTTSGYVHQPLFTPPARSLFGKNDTFTYLFQRSTCLALQMTERSICKLPAEAQSFVMTRDQTRHTKMTPLKNPKQVFPETMKRTKRNYIYQDLDIVGAVIKPPSFSGRDHRFEEAVSMGYESAGRSITLLGTVRSFVYVGTCLWRAARINETNNKPPLSIIKQTVWTVRCYPTPATPCPC